MRIFTYPGLSVNTSGLATEAKQDAGNASLSSIDTKLSSVATTAKQDTGNTSLASIDTKMDNAATWVKQDTGNASLASIDGKLPALDSGLLPVKISSPLGAAASSASIPVVRAATTVSGTGAALNADVIASTDVSGYQTITVQLSGTWSGAVRAQFSNDNSTFTDAVFFDPQSPSTGAQLTMVSNGLRTFQVMGQYFRLRVTSYSSGTVTGTVLLAPNVTPPTSALWAAAVQSGNWNVRMLDSSGNSTAVNFGAATSGLRTAAQIGNASGAADFGSGVVGAQTIRTALASDQLSTLATAAAQTTANTSLASIDTKTPSLGQAAMAASTPVVIASNQSNVPVLAAGRSKVSIVRNDYSSVNVTTSAYTQLIASTSAQINKIQIFDSSGQTMVLAVGAAASEVDQIYIFPGGNGDVELLIPAGSRVSVKAVSATADSGELIINCFG